MIYWQLFSVFFKIGLFSFGGGYAILSLIQKEVIHRYHWVDLSEFTEVVAVSQVTPGPIGINAATYVGYKVGGSVLGALAATLGVVLPSILLLLLILHCIQKFRESKIVARIFLSLRPVVLGLILGAGILLLRPENFTTTMSYGIFALVFVLGISTRISPIYLILASAFVGFLV